MAIFDSKKIPEAIALAVDLHKNQTRKMYPFPYIVHPSAVYTYLMEAKNAQNAAIWQELKEFAKTDKEKALAYDAIVNDQLCEAGIDPQKILPWFVQIDENVLVAGVLHDVVEDCDYPLELIERDFGSTVRSYVDLLTDDKTEEDYAARKKKYALRLKSEAPIEVKLIKCADCISNLGATVGNIPFVHDVWKTYHSSSDLVMEYYNNLRDALDELQGHPLYEKFCFLCQQAEENLEMQQSLGQFLEVEGAGVEGASAFQKQTSEPENANGGKNFSKHNKTK